MGNSEPKSQHIAAADAFKQRSEQIDVAGQRVGNAASGAVDGILLQAGVVHGDIHVHGEAKDRKVVPRQLLPPDEHFIGRARELALLNAATQQMPASSPTVVLLRGPGGVGKTALALQWLGLQKDRFPDGQMYADLTDVSGNPIAPEDLLGQFLRSLGVEPQQVPIGLAERAALFRSVTASRSLAILLDNAVSAAQVRSLLPASRQSVVAVTSRRSLLGLLARGATMVQVAPLDTDAALDLLALRVGTELVKAESGQARRLAMLCGGLPIALCVAAALTVSRPRRSLAWAAEELREEHRRLELLSVDEDMSVRATFDMSYADLPRPAALAYRALGLCPGARYCVELIAAATNSDVPEAQRVVQQLVDTSLLEEPHDGLYRFHDLVRVHARERALNEDTSEIRSAVVRRMLEWYLHVARSASRAVMPARRTLSCEFDSAIISFAVPTEIDGYDNALRWLELERRSLIASVRTATEQGWNGLAYQLADAIQPLFIVHKHLRDAIQVDQVALDAARATGDFSAQNNMSKRLARALARLGEFDQAQRYVEAMLEQTRSSGDRRGEASALKSRGIILVEAGQLELAATAFRDALTIMTELDRPRPQGLVLINLGETLLSLDRLAEAAVCLEQAAHLLSTLHTPDPYNAARARIVLGRVHVQLDQYDAAESLLCQGLSTMIELNSAFEQARAHHALAELARRTGDDQVADEHTQTAARLAGTPELAGLVPDG